MKEWWQGLNQREQWLVGGGTSVLLLVVLYLFFWTPFTASVASKKSYVAYQQNLVSWMKAANKHLTELRSSGSAKLQKIDSSQLLSTVDSALQAAKLNSYANSIQQTSSDKVLVKFKQVPFTLMMVWVNDLWKRHAIKVEQILIKPERSTRGVVSAEVFFAV